MMEVTLTPQVEQIEPGAALPPPGMVIHADGVISLRVAPVNVLIRLSVTDALMIASALAEYARAQLDLADTPPAGAA